MADKYLIAPENGSQKLIQWEEGVGWSYFTQDRNASDSAISIDGSSLSDIWVGTNNNSLSGGAYLEHWDGNSWTTTEMTSPSGYTSNIVVSLASEDNDVYVALNVWASSTVGAILKLNNGNPTSYVTIIDNSDFYFGNKHLAPINDDLCYWSLGSTSSLAGGGNLFRWTSSGGVEQVGVGHGLPNAAAIGIAYASWEDVLYIYFSTGAVYRGTWSGGFSLDNLTDGPFSIISSSIFVSRIAASKSDNFIVASASGSSDEFWVRNSSDSWTNVGPTGVTSNRTNPVALNSDILCDGKLGNVPALSENGGTSWGLTPAFSAQYQVWGYVVPNSPPTITPVSPTDGEIQVSSDVIISLNIEDTDLNLDDDRITIIVEGNTAFENGAFVSPYNGIDSYFGTITGGYRIEIDKTSSYTSFQTVEIDVEAYDALDSLTTLSYSFTTEDTEVPIFVDEFPVNLSTGNSKDTIISISFYDTGADINNIDAYVNDIKVYFGSSFIVGYDGAGSQLLSTTVSGNDGYVLYIDKTTSYNSGETVEVRVDIYDAENNFATYSWEFEIEDYVNPVISNTFPTTLVDVNTDVSFDITDDFSGVDLNNTTVTIGGDTAYSGGFISPFTGTITSITNGYSIVISNPSLYDTATIYNVVVNTQDEYGNTATTNYNFTTRASISNTSLGQFEITLDVIFETDMTQDSNFSNPANYIFTNGAYARKVDILSSTQVRLWVENYYKNNNFDDIAVFRIYLNSDITTLSGDPVSDDAYVTVSPDVSTASFSHYNGLIRTYRDFYFTDADSERIYLSGTRGIDILQRQTATTYTKWAQIFDECGIDAMRVVNHPSVYVFNDTASPSLSNQNPAPNATGVSSAAHVFFSIIDTTAVEIPNVNVYVNGTHVFNGQSGWNSNWSGIIEILHKELYFEIWPRAGFSSGVVSIRVTAEDLSGNISSNTYQFTV